MMIELLCYFCRGMCCVVVMVYMCVCCIQYVLKHYRIDNFLLKFFCAQLYLPIFTK